MKNRISVRSYQKDQPVTPRLRASIRKAVGAALEYEKYPWPAEVSVSLVTRERIRELNREYRGRDSETDVLSFPELEDPARVTDADRDLSGGGEVILGDIILCPAVIAEQAPDFSHSFEQECAYMTVHSALHLLGYDHTLPEDGDVQIKKQDEIFEILEGSEDK